MPFFSVWLVLSADDILHLLVVAHGFPTPLGLGVSVFGPPLPCTVVCQMIFLFVFWPHSGYAGS